MREQSRVLRGLQSLQRSALQATLTIVTAGLGVAAAAEPVQLTDVSFNGIDALVMAAKGRPNEEHRLRGLKSYKNGQYSDALRSFELAAHYADKHSQHYLTLMYWNGVGVERDPVQAYIWSDLAAERGSKGLLVVREQIWAKLSPEQRAEAQARGEAAYERYGDEVAQPRAENVMRRFARNMTGSRVGYRNQRLEMQGRPINGAIFIEVGSNEAAYAAAERASPDELYGRDGGLRRMVDYWQQQDRLLDGTSRSARAAGAG